MDTSTPFCLFYSTGILGDHSLDLFVHLERTEAAESIRLGVEWSTLSIQSPAFLSGK